MLKQTWSTQKFCRPREPVFHCTMESGFANSIIVTKHVAVLPNTGRTVKRRRFFFVGNQHSRRVTLPPLDSLASLRTPGNLDRNVIQLFESLIVIVGSAFKTLASIPSIMVFSQQISSALPNLQGRWKHMLRPRMLSKPAFGCPQAVALRQT